MKLANVFRSTHLFDFILSNSFLKENNNLKVNSEINEVLSELKTKNVKPIQRKEVLLKGKAFWIWGSTVQEQGIDNILNNLSDLRIKHVFLLVKGVSGRINKDVLFQLIPKAHEKKMYVHAWIVCFSDKSWSYEKVSPESYEYRKYLLNIISEFLLLNSSGHFVDGIHLDYIRYSGGAQDKCRYVSSFVREVRTLIDGIAPGTILSIASKVESYTSKNTLFDSALVYGQNYIELAKFIDLFCPMTYYLDYNVTPEKVGVAAKWVKELTDKPVFAGIQLHPSEHPSTKGKKPTPDEIKRNLEACLENKVDGVIFFRYYEYILEDQVREIISRYYNV